MADNLSQEKRSKIMRSIKSKNTKPELMVRKLLTALGYKYRLHRKDLPGRPDIAFLGRKKAIFINGCFWHMHQGCSYAQMPENEFWKKKLSENQARDIRSVAALNELGWSSITVWECELQDLPEIKRKLHKFLGPTKNV